MRVISSCPKAGRFLAASLATLMCAAAASVATASDQPDPPLGRNTPGNIQLKSGGVIQGPMMEAPKEGSTPLGHNGYVTIPSKGDHRAPSSPPRPGAAETPPSTTPPGESLAPQSHDVIPKGLPPLHILPDTPVCVTTDHGHRTACAEFGRPATPMGTAHRSGEAAAPSVES